MPHSRSLAWLLLCRFGRNPGQAVPRSVLRCPGADQATHCVQKASLVPMSPTLELTIERLRGCPPGAGVDAMLAQKEAELAAVRKAIDAARPPGKRMQRALWHIQSAERGQAGLRDKKAEGALALEAAERQVAELKAAQTEFDRKLADGEAAIAGYRKELDAAKGLAESNGPSAARVDGMGAAGAPPTDLARLIHDWACRQQIEPGGHAIAHGHLGALLGAAQSLTEHCARHTLSTAAASDPNGDGGKRACGSYRPVRKSWSGRRPRCASRRR